MSKVTYGQLVDGKRITYDEFQKQCGALLKGYLLLKFSPKLCKKLYNQGYSVSDACSFLILNAK